MAIRNGYYIVKPTSKLVDFISQHNQTNLGKTVIWKLPESSDIHQNLEETFVGYVKVSFLANMIAMYEYLKPRKQSNDYEKVIHKVFGDPPEYKIESLDGWWSFERAETLKEYPYEISQVSTDILRQIQKIDDVVLDTWLTSLIAKKDLTDS